MKFLSALILALALVLSGAHGVAMMTPAKAAPAAASPCDEMMMQGAGDPDPRDDTSCMVGGHCDFCPAAAVFIPASPAATIAFENEIPYAVETAPLTGVAPQPAAPPPRV